MTYFNVCNKTRQTSLTTSPHYYEGSMGKRYKNPTRGVILLANQNQKKSLHNEICPLQEL